MQILIKNMVCRHCVEAVEKIFRQLGVENACVTLGLVEIDDKDGDRLNLDELDGKLHDNGFERITDRNMQLVEQIKRVIIRHVRIERNCQLKVSACIEKHLAVGYDTASRIFSSIEGRTIEKYFIAQKIELVKELLCYNQLTLTEIAEMAGYSSVASLSRQFKDVTGMTPTAFLRSPHTGRSSIAEV